jgi:hypothetical protein
MNTDDSISGNKSKKDISPANPEQQNKNPEGEREPGEGTLIGKEPASGMSMGATFDESKEQDMDDLIHQQGGLHTKTELPGPDEV